MRARWAWLAALAITLLGLALRLDGFLSLWINADEGIYYSVAHAPWAQARAELTGNAHPPLYFYLLRALAPLSDGWHVLRLPALLCGSGAILAMFVLGRRAHGTVAGLLAAALLALSPGAIMQSQIVRPYMTQLLLLTLALAGLIAWWRDGRRRDLVAYAVCLVLAQGVHYATFQFIAALGVCLGVATLARRLSRRRIAELAIAHVPVLLAGVYLYLFHIRGMMGGGMQSEAQTGWLRPYFATDAADLWRSVVGVFEYVAGTQLSGVAALVFVAALLVCLLRRHVLLAGLAVTTLAIAAVLAQRALYPLGSTRHSIYLAALLLPAVAIGGAELLQRSRRTAFVAIAALALAVIARAPIDDVLGVLPLRPKDTGAGGAFRPPVQLEIFVPVSEVEGLAPQLDALMTSPGALILDQYTDYALAPLFQQARQTFEQIGPIRRFRWGERQVFLSKADGAWLMPGGPRGTASNTHLAWLLVHAPKARPRLLDCLRGDVRVLSMSARPHGAARLPNEVHAVAQITGTPPALSELWPGDNICLFRLDATSYLASIDALR